MIVIETCCAAGLQARRLEKTLALLWILHAAPQPSHEMCFVHPAALSPTARHEICFVHAAPQPSLEMCFVHPA